MRDIDSLIKVNGDLLHICFKESRKDVSTIVFLHDSLGCISLWRDFTYQLAEATNCNLLVYDRKGYGKSDPLKSTQRANDYLEAEADTLYSLLVQLHINNAILFGHSDGGSIALIAAAKYPNIVKGVISEAAHIFVEPETINGIEAAVKSYRDKNLKSRLTKYHGAKAEAVFHAWSDTWLSNGYRSWNIEHFLPNIICPTLIIQGENDEYGTMKQVEGIAKQVSGPSEICILPGIGHTPHKEAAIETLKRAKSFIALLVIG